MRANLSLGQIRGDLRTGVPLLRLTRWSMGLTVAAAPLYVLRWRVGPIPTTLLEMLILLTVGLYAITLIIERAPLPRRTGLEVPIALFLIAGAVAVFAAPDHRGALGIYRAYLLEPVAVYYVAVAILDSTAVVESLLAVWAVGAIVFSGVEILTVAYAVVTHSLNPGHAAAALGINPNSVAIYLEPVIAIAAGFALFGESRRRQAAIATLAIVLVAELATLSRGGLVSLAALAGIAIVTAANLRLRLAMIGASAVGVLAVLALPIISTRVEDTTSPTYGTLENRGRIWAATFRMLHDHPVLGAGLNAYQSTMAPYRLADRNLRPEPYPHNIFLTTWSELGLLGLVAFTWLFAMLLIAPWRALSRSAGIYKPILWGTGTAFAMLLVHGLVDSPYWKNDLSVEFWVLAALEAFALVSVSLKQRRPAA